ncbi:MAG: winged helix-turn-helix domain-containing protein [Holophagales bacterium]|nr:winged helix-turn-helix domain-containing protein [Holophagales bacterium]MYC09607.1 winged helix-turn-helix domain-containing protein [Holophagales bacterium]
MPRDVADAPSAGAGRAEITVRDARRLALARAGLLNPEWTGLPGAASGRGLRARRALHALIGRFGYLQLDTISIAGARTHALVPLSRWPGIDRNLPEELLQPGEPLFEYWGHEASWIPIDLYPAFGFRRKEYRNGRTWHSKGIREHPDVAKAILRRVEAEGPMRSLDLTGPMLGEMWRSKRERWVAYSLWSTGELAIRSRRNFQRTFDLPERVIPERWRNEEWSLEEGIRALIRRALEGHGWATIGTLADTWRLKNVRPQTKAALEDLTAAGEATPCDVIAAGGKRRSGWVRPADLELAARLRRVRPAPDRGVLLSPFDPVLWRRPRVAHLFGFDQILEIFKPASQRSYGYYCMPVLAGDRLVARFDLKAHRREGRLEVLALHYEADGPKPPAADRAAAESALSRFAESVELAVSD